MYVFLGSIVWILLCILIGKCAERWNRSFVKYLILSIILSPLIMGIILLIMGKNNEEKTLGNKKHGVSYNQRNLLINEKKCKSCGSIISEEYKRCPNCNSNEFFDGNINLSSVEKITITTSEYKIKCPFCNSKIELNISDKNTKYINCTKCNKKINLKNAKFID